MEASARAVVAESNHPLGLKTVQYPGAGFTGLREPEMVVQPAGHAPLPATMSP
jgi:hypothetical protein